MMNNEIEPIRMICSLCGNLIPALPVACHQYHQDWDWDDDPLSMFLHVTHHIPNFQKLYEETLNTIMSEERKG